MTHPPRIPVPPPVDVATRPPGPEVLTWAARAVRRKFASMAGQRTVDGYDLQSYLGAVVTALYEHHDAHLRPHERGFIVVRRGLAWVVYGPAAARRSNAPASLWPPARPRRWPRPIRRPISPVSS